MMWKIVLASALLLVANGAYSADRIDNESSDVKSLANALCMSSSKRISHQSTIDQLTDYFESLTPESELKTCSNQYLEPLKDLKVVLETSSGNVCSKEKMESINKFHWDYIVGTLSKKWRKASEKSLPEPLRLFFMHYADMVTEKCKRTLLERLELSSGGKSPAASIFSDKFGGSVIDLTMSLVPANKVTNYDSFYLIFNQIIIKERKKGRTFEPPVDELTGEPVLALALIKNPRKAWAVQDKCRLELRPVYQETVFPVMRLLEMGYGQVQQVSQVTFSANKLIGDWYAATQLCELLIPINFYKDSSLREGQAALITGDRLNEFKAFRRSAADVKSVHEISTDIKISSRQLSDLIEWAAYDEIIKDVKSNLEARNHVIRKLFKNFLSNLTSKFASKLKSFFVSKSTKDNKYVKVSGDNIIKESEAEIKELVEDNDEDPDLKSLVRNSKEKREKSRADIDHEVKVAFNTVCILILLLMIPAIAIPVSLAHG